MDSSLLLPLDLSYLTTSSIREVQQRDRKSAESRDYHQLPTSLPSLSLTRDFGEDAILIYLRGNKVILACNIYPNN